MIAIFMMILIAPQAAERLSSPGGAKFLKPRRTSQVTIEAIAAPVQRFVGLRRGERGFF